MSERVASDAASVWEDVAPLGELCTCYSSAFAVWAAFGQAPWRKAVNSGLHLAVVETDGLHFGFSHFPAELGRTLGLARCSSDDPTAAVASILDELAASDRVVVAADGFNLPWHVAHHRRHLPHWFVIARRDGDVAVVDPFTCRNDLGLQRPFFEKIDEGDLASLVAAVPLSDPVVALRETFALGVDDRPLAPAAFRWLRHTDVPKATPPQAIEGAAAIRVLADHFRRYAARLDAYRQADDLWSIARHRAFLSHCSAQAGGELRRWNEEYGDPLARRWGHVAPLLMQAVLALEGGRTPTTSLPDTLDELAGREERAAAALPALFGAA